MTTLFDSQLSGRDYASHLLHVGDLLAWAKSKHLHLKTTPPIDGSEFVQVEALLCGIERHAGELTPDQAINVVINNPVLKNDPALQKLPDDIDPTICLWLLGAAAHGRWRELLSCAIAAHELELLDFGSKLPINNAPVKNTAMPAPVVAESASDAPASHGNIMKKAALIAELEHEWRSIEADISEATRNGLNTAAHTRNYGEWDRNKARAWAVSKGKIKQNAPIHSLAAAWSGAGTRNTIGDR